MKNPDIILVSFSGGRSSAFLAKYMKERYPEKCIFVFANTGKERDETLDFVHRCDKEWDLGVVWIEALINPIKGKGTRHKIVNYNTAKRTKEKGPFDDLIEKFTIPNNNGPICTRELKMNPIVSYMSREKGFKYWHTALGMRSDEPSRLKLSTNSKYDFIYPLANEMTVTEGFIRTWWSRQPFDLQLKDYEGNCDLCFKKSLRKRLTLISENPGIEKWWEDKENGSQYVFDRDGYSISQLRAMAKANFSKVMDKHQIVEMQYKLDFEKGCFCQSA